MSITPECYSGILVKNTPSFRKGLGVGYICRFLRFSFSFTSLIPCLLPPRDEREKTERTTAQLPANKKCCLLIFAIAIGCLVLAAIPASFPPFSFLSAVMLCGVPDNALGVLGCTLRFRPREIPFHYKKIALKCDFSCTPANFSLSLHPKAQRRGLEGGRCPLSESQII